ncbi:MAG: hypothetical protein IJ760_05680 [Bacteroidales bacterium]|nr:hypothetical protein [Bacteroidales bacterium]
MKSRTLLLGAIFMLWSLVGRAQIVQMLSQSFESGEATNFTVSPDAGEQYSTTLYTSGARSIHLVQQSDSDVEMVLDTLDFTENTSLRYIALRFDHMAILEKNKSGDYTIATIKYKLAHQTDAQWKTMGATEYDMTGETYSSAFVQTLCFNENSYDAWRNFTTVENSQWRSERFNLNNVITPTIPTEQRKLIIKFVLKKRDLTTTLDPDRYAWWIDNISVSASAEQMVSPRINMLVYPYCDEYPNSRGARIVMDATTTMTQGLNPDSIYIDYLPGSSDTPQRIVMQSVAGYTNRYMGFIPFYGYDTLMRFRCEVRDNSNNINAASFPNARDAWISYHHIRGFERHNDNPPNMTVYAGSNSAGTYPFPDCADMRCEILYDSATMRGFGYGPGAITSFKFIAKNSSNSAQEMKRMQVKMKNVPSSFTHDPNVYVWDFYKDYMPIAYDDSYTLPIATAGDTINFQLQDTFYYTGNDILMLITIDNDDDPKGLQLKMTNTPNSKKSLSTYQISAFYGADIFTAESGMNTTSNFNDRPIFLFNEEANMPLLYDAGISELIDPNYDLAMAQRPGSITVRLKNFGANDLTGVRISYSIDDTTTGYYDWSGFLSGGAEQEVLIADKEIDMPAGFHVLKVWVEDTVTSGAFQFRDHEPNNDTMSTPFIICDGPLNGVRNIGGDKPDYNDIDEFLFSLKRCGIDDSLIVRVAPGEYPPFTIPAVNGLSEEHYIVFESMDSLLRPVVVFDTNSTQSYAAVDLQYVDNIRFRRFDFERRNGTNMYMVEHASSSVNMRFEECRFTDSLDNPSADMRINAMIHTTAGNLTVDGCLFEGGRVGVDASGTSATDPTVGIVVRGSTFRNQYENALRLEYITDATVEGNEMYDVVSNANAVMLVNSTDGNVRLVANKIFTSHGASALALNNVNGSEGNHVLVANNMIVGDDDGSAGLMRTLVNVAQGSYIDVVYNSVKLNGPTRGNVAAVTFGGSGISNSVFVNNMVASMDKVNYALNYQPGTDTTNKVHHNVYYSKGSVLNRRGSTSCLSMAAWITAEPADTTSVNEDPVFLNAGVVDLRTFKRSLMGLGVPIATVLEDMFGNVRGIDSTCPGAFEFSALAFDFTPLALLNPEADNCSMPEQVELQVRLMNDGVNDYTAETEHRLTLSWQVNGGTVHSAEISEVINAEGTVDISTGSLYNMPPNGIYDSLYIVRFWTSFADDPNPTNDTVNFRVYSRYHPAAPAEIERWVDYATIDTITVTNGLDEWSTYNHSGAPLTESKVFWYLDSASTEPFWTGKTFVTDQIRQDTTFYIRQRRSLPVLRFTQLEMSKTASAAGPTSPMPSWISDNRRMALEITNVGDATAYLEGDTLLMVSPTSNLNNKAYRFGNVKIEPGKTLVMQFAASAVTDSSVTLHTDISPTQLSYSSNIGLVYISNNAIVDALAVNSVVTANSTQTVKWTSLGVPSYVWSGSGVSMKNNTAGMIRVAFNGNADDWELSSEDFPMHLGQADEDWIMYQDMGCEGDVAKVKINAVGVPLVDLSVDELILPEGGCDMGDEEITIRVTNYGVNTVNGMTVNYMAGSQVVSENIDADLPTNADTLYTFIQTLDLKFSHDSIVEVTAWVSHNVDDFAYGNDTIGGTVHTKYTPDAPTAIADHETGYGSRDTIQFPAASGVSPVWYNGDLIPIDTGFVHITDIIYETTSLGVSLLVNDTLDNAIGTDQVPNESNGYPSPYQSYYKNARQQYIYTASELLQAGMRPGFINSVSFYLDTVLGNSNSVTLNNYTLSVGFTSDTSFASISSWKNVTNVVYTASHFVVEKSASHSWIEHPFETPLAWDGMSSIVVQVDYSLDASYTSGVRTYYSEKTASALYKAQNSALPNPIGNGTVTAKRPNIRMLEVIEGCNGAIAMFSVQPVNIPEIDAAITWEDGYDTVTFSSCEEVGVGMVLHSQGTSSLEGVEVFYSLDGAEAVASTVGDEVSSGETLSVELFSQILKPGLHHVKAYISVEGDAVKSNDTIERNLVVRFCGGDYVVSQSQDADFATINGMLDTLHEVGILGSVVFHLPDNNYAEQAVIHEVFGSSAMNTITLKGDNDNTAITAATASASNYVVLLDSTHDVFIEGITMRSAPASGNFANVLVVDDSRNIHLNGVRLVAASSVINANASPLFLSGNVENISVTNSVMDSGYYAIRNAGTLKSVRIENNEITNFANYGVNLRNVEVANIEKNVIRSANSSNDRALTGVQVSSSTDSLSISKNQIYLIDATQGGKRGIQLNNVVATAINPARITNNMIGTHSTNSKGLNPTKSAGIWIDTASTYVNVYFNTVSIYATTVTNNSASDASYALHTGATTSHLEVMNNVLHNASYGYAYHMLDANNVVSSNNNVYFSSATNPFYIKDTPYGSLAALQAANSDDGQSLFEEPFFEAEDDLRLTIAAFIGKGQYNPDVPDDIFDTPRGQNPPPTVGAVQMFLEEHDIAILNVVAPYMASGNASPYIETDSVSVVVTFYNNGAVTENNVKWYAYVDGNMSDTRSADKVMNNFLPFETRTDTVKMPTPRGLVYDQTVLIFVECADDTVINNNSSSVEFYIKPAFNIAAKLVRTRSGCGLKKAPVSIQLKNEGMKPIPSGSQIKIGYGASVTSPANYTVSTMPSKVEQTVTLTAPLAVGDTLGYTFTQLANLYPTDSAIDIKVRVRGWAKYQYDLVVSNDTTATSSSYSPIKDSYFVPADPQGHDTTLAYGTWGKIWAEQANGLPVRWYRDTNATPFFTGSVWTNSPQYFHDSTYYLRSVSSKGCSSDFKAMTVSVGSLMQRDMACEAVLKPIGSRVYMENDTVRVRVANYGSQTQSNVPVVFELRRGNELIQKVSENIPASITSHQTYEYTFSTLLDIPTPTSAQTYTLRAYTNLSNDGARANDTVHTLHTFTSLSQDRYNNRDWTPDAEVSKFDITRLSFNSIDLDIPYLNRTVTDMANYDQPEYPVLHVRRGTTDSLLIQVTPNASVTQRFRCRTTVAVDLDRDGLFSHDTNGCDERLVDAEPFWNDSVFRAEITIPECASYGYMRMRVQVSGYDPSSTEGHVIDLLLFVDADAPSKDIAITQMVTPRDFRINDDSPTPIAFRLTNKGKDELTELKIYYRFEDDNFLDIINTADTIIDDITGDTIINDTTGYGVYLWTGSLPGGQSTVVTLPSRQFELGVTTLTIWHELENDADASNNMIEREYYRFHEIEVTLNDNFDDLDLWYAPRGYNEFSRNFWQHAKPNKNTLKGTHSGDLAWVTDATKTINTGVRGNVSYLYSPIIDNTSIRPDTIAFYMVRNLTGGSEMHIEFLNAKNQWQKLETDSSSSWYNDEELLAFSGSSGSFSDYTRYYTASTKARPDYRQGLQFRVVYTTPIGNNTSASYGDGCAIDDFHIGRGRRAVDVGVTNITYPDAPRFGRTYQPKVDVHNFGTDTIRNLQIGYIHYGAGLSKVSTLTCELPPDATQEFELLNAFEVTSDYPDSFYIVAFTINNSDLYIDNDTATRLLHIMPLNGDISAEELIEPTAKVVAGDTTVPVTLRLRNFGINPISSATACYSVNGKDLVCEYLDFEQLLGKPLESMEYYNYTFEHKLHATMGTMDIVSHLECDGNEYSHNDTVFKRINGIMAVTDLAATAIFIDESTLGEYHVAVEIENRGTRGANNFIVGYWINDDLTTLITEDYIRATPLPALNKGYYLFNYFTIHRPDNIKAMVYITGDNNRANDTTDVLGEPNIDIAVKRVIVEENAADDCRLFLEVVNVGNVPLVNRQFAIEAVVNGNTVSTLVNQRLEVGQTYTLPFSRRIPKSLQRTYVGTGRVSDIKEDTNSVNDMTSVVQVVNYVEGIQNVREAAFVLEQNRPNPFHGLTTVPFSLPVAADVHFFVVDALGHTLHQFERHFDAGDHTVTLNLEAYPAGVYYYGIEVDGIRQMRKMIVK